MKLHYINWIMLVECKYVTFTDYIISRIALCYVANTNAMTSHDGSTNASGIMWFQFWCQWHHATINDVAPHFNCPNLRNDGENDDSDNGIEKPKNHIATHLNFLDLKNAMLLLLVPLASCGVKTSAYVAPHFHYLYYTNVVVPFVMSLASYVATNGITWPQKSFSSPVHYLDLTCGMVP